MSGGTSGLGKASAVALAEHGAQVWVLGSRDETVAETRAEGALAGGSVCDVSDEVAVASAFGELVEALGGLDGAFVNAGIDGEDRSVLDLSVDHFRRVLDVNVVGAFLVSRAAARAIDRDGAIVVNASVNGVRPERGFADYNASKAAAITLAKTMALDLAERAIAVTAICPGYIRTRMTATYLDDDRVAARLRQQIPAGRFGEPEEVARLVTFLLSPEAGYLTGTVITIDGGRSV